MQPACPPPLPISPHLHGRRTAAHATCKAFRSTALAMTGVLLVLVPAVHAAETLKISVFGGTSDRPAGPVTVLVAAPAEPALVSVKSADGTVLPGQLTEPSLAAGPAAAGKRELHFIAPVVPAGGSLTFEVDLAARPPESPGFAFKGTDSDQKIDLAFNGRAVLQYVCPKLDDSSPAKREPTYKPFHHVYDPAGKKLLTKGPGGKFTHHRGVYYGFNRVTYGPDNKKADVWHCSGTAHQSHEKVIAQVAGPVLARQTVEIAWRGVGKEIFAKETRELTVWATKDGTLIEFASRLDPVIAPIRLDGDPQHAGFHFRAAGEVADKTSAQTIYVRPDGIGEPGKTRNWDSKTKLAAATDLPWNAMSFVVEGDRYSVAYLDRPDNPKQARFSERDYGRFGSYFEYDLPAGKSLVVNYRLWLQTGQITQAQAAAHREAFVIRDGRPTVR